MKLKAFILLLLLLNLSCARNQVQSDYNEEPFYFSLNKGGVYKYDGVISKVSSESINSITSSQLNHNIFLASHSSMNLMKNSGNIIHRYESKDVITSAVISTDETNIFYINQTGELYKYNLNTSQKNKIDMNLIYPLPVQMIYDQDKNSIFYHDGFYVYEIDIDNQLRKRISTKLIAIASIAYQASLNRIYFSTGVDGEIYAIDLNTELTFSFYKPRSANGSLISINSSEDQLYFSRTNGRDTIIKSLNLQTYEENTVKVLSNIKKINQFSF
tara:strand:- start:1894 stop:2709 length:816 start_codon:yes stop_codon:yes gene_type:complete